MKHSRLDEFEAYVSGAESLWERALENPVVQIVLAVITYVVAVVLIGCGLRILGGVH